MKYIKYKKNFIRINNKEFMIFKLVYIYFFLYLLCNMYDIYLFGRKCDFFSCKFVFIFILNEFGLLIIIYLRFIIVRYVYF